MNERIKLVRKSTNLTQTEFGARIGVKGNTITNYELGLRNPSDAVIFSICREFNVNEEWLRTGKGEMFLRLDEDAEFDYICTQIQLSDDKFIKGVIRSYWKLTDEKKAVIRELIDGIYEK